MRVLIVCWVHNLEIDIGARSCHRFGVIKPIKLIKPINTYEVRERPKAPEITLSPDAEPMDLFYLVMRNNSLPLSTRMRAADRIADSSIRRSKRSLFCPPPATLGRCSKLLADVRRRSLRTSGLRSVRRSSRPGPRPRLRGRRSSCPSPLREGDCRSRRRSRWIMTTCPQSETITPSLWPCWPLAHLRQPLSSFQKALRMNL
jgi:hypothetical protein